MDRHYLVTVNYLDWMIFMKMIPANKRFLKDFVNDSTPVLYHVGLAGLSAVIALSLPWILNFIAKEVLVYWAFLGNEKLLVVSIEMAVAILLAFFFNAMVRSWKDRQLSNMAKDAGLVLVKPANGFFTRRRVKKMKEEQGFAKRCHDHRINRMSGPLLTPRETCMMSYRIAGRPGSCSSTPSAKEPRPSEEHPGSPASLLRPFWNR